MTHTAKTLQAAFKYLFPDEVPALKSLAQSLPDNPRVINIGAGSGTSGLALAESRDDLWLTTIDVQETNSPYGCLYAERQVLKQAGLWGERTNQIRGDSVLVGQDWGDGEVDMVFIDGDHSYEACKGDILAWMRHIKPGGIIALHDYRKGDLFESETDFHPDKPHPKPWPGVDRAVEELLVPDYEVVLHVDSLIAFRA